MFIVRAYVFPRHVAALHYSPLLSLLGRLRVASGLALRGSRFSSSLVCVQVSVLKLGTKILGLLGGNLSYDHEFQHGTRCRDVAGSLEL